MKWLASCLLVVVATAVWSADDGLVASWRLDKPGPQIEDLSGKGHSATLTGGQIVTEGERHFLRMDGKTRLEVPSAPDLCLRKGFSIEMRVRPSDLTDGRCLASKADEYLLRIDWPKENRRLSWFVNVDGYEPRVSSFEPALNTWYHVVAIWDGVQSVLWVNGLPYTQSRYGDAPAATNNPLLICTDGGYARGMVGDLEYCKVYNRPLTTSEVISAAYGLSGGPVSPAGTAATFDFAKGAQGWAAREGATVTPTPGGLAVSCANPFAGVMQDNLNVDVSPLDFLTLRMATDKGATATVVYVTSAGAGRIAVPLVQDGQPHTYILEPWQYPGWAGRLMLLGVLPSNEFGAHATLRYVRATPEAEGEGELALQSLTTDATLPRAGRPEKVTARIANNGGGVQGVKLTLRAPAGAQIAGPSDQVIPTLAYHQNREVTWTVRAAKPLTSDFRVTASATNANTASLTTPIGFLPALNVTKSDYVPVPRPIDTGPYQIWTHYCPLWKQGTHYGWKMIEPWPNRKPVLGWYNEGTPEVADWHIKYWLEHGISAVIYCWYRASINGPVTQTIGHAIHDGLLKAKYLPMIKFGIMWENGCGQGCGSPQDLLDNVLPFWLDNYFTNPSYLKIDGKPVLYIWVPSNVTKHLGGSDQVRETFDIMRQRCRERGLKGLYIVGCCGGVDKESLERMKLEGWDATSAYGNGWTYPADMKRAGNFMYAPAADFAVQQEAIWKGKQEIGALPDITSAMMGWDSRPWNETPFYFSDNTPQTFRDLCVRAKAVMDSRTGDGPDRHNIIFCCWNEFGEGHYIEPTRGYGFSYLDTIRDVFTKAPKEHTDVCPEDVGLGPYDSWYQAAKQAGLEHTTQQSSWAGKELAQWSGMMGISKAEVQDGALKLTIGSRDPAISSPSLKLRGSKFSHFVVEMKTDRAATAQVFWTSVALPHTSEGQSSRCTTLGDGQFHRYVFEVGQNESWGGCVTSLRFDPTDLEGALVEIKSIGLE